MKLKVSSANFYVGNKQIAKDARFLASLGCDLNGIQEGHSDNARVIKETLKDTHITFWGRPKDKEKAFATLDVPVTYKKTLKVYRQWARLINKRSQKKNIGMPRAATAVRFEKGGYNVTFINTHCNAAVQSRSTGRHLRTSIRRVLEYTRGMVVLEGMIRNAQKRGDLVVLVGDLNYALDRDGIWKFSPQALFKRTGLHFRVHRIDYIAYSKGFKPSNFETIGTGRTGSDHEWITLELETK